MVNIPNALTLLRLLLIPVFLVASFRGMFFAALVLFVTAAMTDIFDGLIARRLNQRSRLGAILDPAADKAMLIGGYLYYTLAANLPADRIPVWLTFAVFARDLLIIVFAYLLYTRVRVKRFPPSLAGKISTVLQAVTLGAVVAANAFVPGMSWFAELMFRVALLITLFSGSDYIRRAKRLLEEGLATLA